MKAILAFTSGIILFSVIAFQTIAKDHGHGHGHGNGKGHGHYKNYYKGNKHYCNMHCHHGDHHIYREKVVILQPAPRPRPSVTISLPLL